jgi:CP family cyanate transporter-like MFS transporter
VSADHVVAMITTVGARAQHAIAVGAALILIALNLRFALAAVSPVLEELRDDLGLSNIGAGLLTTAPLLCFGLAAPLAPILARRVGQEVLLLGCMVLVAAGITLRIFPSVGPLFAGTIVLGVAIAIANVLMPSVIKRRFPRPGVMMGLYTTALSISAALAGGLTVPLEQAFGSWRWALAIWAIPAIVAALAWLPASRHAGSAPTVETGSSVSLWRDRKAWLVTGTFGMQSLLFYAMLTWLPDILRDAGLSAAHAGGMLSVAMFFGLPTSLVVPVIAARLPDQRPLALVGPAFWAAGFIGLLLSPATLTAVWMMLLGFGQGMGISLALTLVVLRSPDGRHAATLSGMAQSVGYTLAATGPIALGAMHDLTGGWDAPIVLMLVGTVALVACGLGASRPGSVGSRASAATD